MLFRSSVSLSLSLSLCLSPLSPHIIYDLLNPFLFLSFFSDLILEAMDYAVYRDDVKHIILDNLQVRKEHAIN